MIKGLLRSGFNRADSLLESAFAADANPFRQLGTLGWFFYWIVIVTGIYLYIFFDTGITEAYNSVEYLTHEQWYAGGIMRSLHRYASDALVIVVILHLLREYAWDRLHGPRYFAWVTGIALLWFLYASGISGYWIVWDKLAQYVAIATTEWLDTLPFFGEPIARNFINEASLSGRFFTLLIFIHIFVPLLMLFVMWLHIQRLTQPRVNPPAGLVKGSLAALLLLSLALPAESQGPAVLAEVPANLGLDWYYLFLYPLLDHMPGLVLWLIVFALSALLLVLPWLPPVSNPVAVVDLDNCNGCGRCAEDCPYSAITMRPRTDSLPYQTQAEVDADLCTGCGICTGSCPTATPFRRRSDLIPGILLEGYTMQELRQAIVDRCDRLPAGERILLVGCEQGPDLDHHGSMPVATLRLPCVGMLPPAFLDFVISRKYVDGVCLAGCRTSDCYQRFGNTWTMQRINRQRDPYLRERIDRNRIRSCWTGTGGQRELQETLDDFRRELADRKPESPCRN